MRVGAEDRCLIMFVRFPGQGQVKSRLAKDLDAEVATNLYRCFVQDLSERLSREAYRLCIAFHPGDKEREMREMLGDEFSYFPQMGEDLGERMKLAFLRCFSEGARSVVLIGSDIPDLPARIVDEAFRALDKCGAVIGPSVDGGYYLIGFRQDTLNGDVFAGLPWGEDSVFQETMNILRMAGDPVHMLPVWRDIDNREDIRALIKTSGNEGFADSKTMLYLKARGLA
ncbi:MAG: TIGR04282 family arsenosugar biosynthesis glycosyltransferase [Syntrophales bacterium LBB04]|nr:TIGR04282 family arsenosugar biosynthesis glycosyltransferase [Syntrophales bacterium LBB04]